MCKLVIITGVFNMLPQNGKNIPFALKKNTNFYLKPHIKSGSNLVFTSVCTSASPTYELLFLLTVTFEFSD